MQRSNAVVVSCAILMGPSVGSSLHSEIERRHECTLLTVPFWSLRATASNRGGVPAVELAWNSSEWL